MLLTLGFFALVAFTSIAFNPFLVAGLVIADLILVGLLVQLIGIFVGKQVASDMQENMFNDDFFDN